MELNLKCKYVDVSPSNNAYLNVSIDGADISDVIEHVKLEEFISHFEIDDILNCIGKEECEIFLEQF